MTELRGMSVLLAGAGESVVCTIARRLATSGAQLVLAGGSDVASLAESLDPGQGGIASATYFTGDPTNVDAAISAGLTRFGRIDCLILAASGGAACDFARMSDADWHWTVTANLAGAYHVVRRAMPHMAPGTSTVLLPPNVAGPDGGVHIGTAGGGILAMARALAAELAPDIRVNAVAAGGSVEAVADVVLFLCSDRARYISGQTVPANGIAC